MAYSLRTHHFLPYSDAYWFIEGPSWLDGLSRDPAIAPLIREIHDENHCCDRYALVSAEELYGWHKAAVGTDLDQFSEATRAKIEAFERRLTSGSPAEIYILEWYQWESGYD